MRVCRLAVPILTTLVFAALAAAQGGPTFQALDADGVQKLIDLSGGGAKVSLDPATGAARFVRFEPGSLKLAVTREASAEKRALAFFRQHGSIFGMTDLATELEAVRTFRDALGSEHAVFVQSYRGLPVFGGELRAHFNPGGELYAVNGTFVPALKLDHRPLLSSEQAAEVAIRTVSRQQDGRPVTKQRGDLREQEHLEGKAAARDLAAVGSELTVFRAGLVRGLPGRDHLVYEVEVADEAVTVREFVYVDAHSGEVVDQITGIHEHHALHREIYDPTLTPANLRWDELVDAPFPPLTGNTDWDNELWGAQETYYVFGSMTVGSYLSYDGSNATMITVNNDPSINCPNANWNGISTNYCTDVTGDDTVAHEWGHAYTEYTNDLVYQWQSGALSESYSDIWGEATDFLNGRGLDAPDLTRSSNYCSSNLHGANFPGNPTVDTVRWLSGEDDPAFFNSPPGSGNAIRDLWDPTCFGDPGKVTDTEYWCDASDSGGVHSNSGVPNHAFALMVDGGTYNGETITALGLTKAAHIHWGAQNLLTTVSDFVAHADALEAACATLTGVNLPALSASTISAGLSGEVISAADCTEVAQAIAAVELRTPPTQCNFVPLLDPDAPALCDGLGSVQTIAVEDWEGGSLPAGWNVGTHDVVSPGTFSTPDWAVVNGLPAGANGTYAAFVADLVEGDCVTDVEAGALSLDSPAIALPAGEVPRVAFDHWVATEAGWDGGNLEVSVNGGAFIQVPGSAYDFNAYNGALSPASAGNDNPLAGEEAFTGADGGSLSGSWGQSQVNLIGLAAPGDTVRLRFDFGVDGCNGLLGWYVDDVHVYSCSDEEPPICGDGELNSGEVCDDGNTDDGDGCSSSCQVEDGWVCENPTPPSSGTNVVADGSFEAGPGGGVWLEFSSNFGTPICDVGSCGTGTGTGPSDGAFWTWFGGIAASEAGIVAQDVTIPPTATNLTFDLEQIICDSADDYAVLFVDGFVEWFTLGSSPLCGTLGYTPQTVNLSAYADGGVHELWFQSEIFALNGGGSNFFLDNVVLSDNVAIPGSPSVCTEIVTEVACNGGGVGFDEGIPAAWTVVDNAGLGLLWSNIAGAGEIGNYTGGDGDAATVSSDVFGPADFDTELVTNTFSLANAASASLDYLVNYQNYAALDFLDVDISTDGGSSWASLLSWNEDHGAFRGTPGEAVSLDLAAYLGASDVRLRWRYYDPTSWDWDWYAQVDDVALTCNLKPDCAGATASPDTLWPPNHQFVAITVSVTDPDGDPVTVTIDSIFQDESVNGQADGNTVPDGQGVGTSTAEVRAERSGKGDGRVYHIGFTADDGRGGTCSGEVLVGVPHDQGGGSTPIDGGALFDSTVAP